MKTFTAPLIFPHTGQELAPWRPEFIGTGCRGVIGPVPRPLWMRFRVPESNIQLSPHILFIRRLDVNWVFKTPTRGIRPAHASELARLFDHRQFAVQVAGRKNPRQVLFVEVN